MSGGIHPRPLPNEQVVVTPYVCVLGPSPGPGVAAGVSLEFPLRSGVETEGNSTEEKETSARSGPPAQSRPEGG